ncbi:glycosyltransferase family 9 protein [Deferribacteres bacterium DY0037]
MMTNRRVTNFHRFADRYAGIPLIFLPSLYRKRRGKPGDIRRICLIKTSGIGDTVLMSAVVKDILKHYHNCRITVVTGIANYYAAKFLIGRLSDNIDFKVADLSDFSSIFDLRHLKEFDISIDFGQWPRFDAFISMLIKSRYRVGFKRDRQYRHYGYDLPVEHKSDRHELNNFRALAEALGIICLYGTDITDLYENADISDNSICVHMCASGKTASKRMWSMDKWAELIRHLDDKGYDIIFSGTYDEREYIEAVAGFAGLSTCTYFLERHLEELVPVMRKCRYVISVDTGIAHLAGACGANLIELLGATNPERWGALGENVTYVRSEFVGKMLDLGHESDADFDAMERIGVDQVLRYIL